MPKFQSGVIIGAGVIGLAIASELSESGLAADLWVLEKERSFGSGISSRNSEVIHRGLYYPEGSLKAQLCIEGRDRLYYLCARHSIPHRPIGKLLVAVDDQELEDLHWIEHNAGACGIALELTLSPPLAYARGTVGSASGATPTSRCWLGHGLAHRTGRLRMAVLQPSGCGGGHGASIRRLTWRPPLAHARGVIGVCNVKC